jgi:hypothetical protein
VRVRRTVSSTSTCTIRRASGPSSAVNPPEARAETAASAPEDSAVTFTQPVAIAAKAGLRGALPCISPSWFPTIPYHGIPSPTARNGRFMSSNRPGKSRTSLERWASRWFSSWLGEYPRPSTSSEP